MHFFVDPNKIEDQNGTPIETFGPDSNDPDTVYHLNTKFQPKSKSNNIEKAPAFACVRGQIIVQQSSLDTDLVNVILKPLQDLSIPLKVDYFIYRGILKSDLISGTKIASGPSELITRIFNQVTSAPDASTIGYDNSLNGTINIEKLFQGEDPNSPQGVFPIEVEEGEFFGNFAFKSGLGPSFSNYNSIGFEVIMDSDRLNVDLNYLWLHDPLINVNSLSGLEEKSWKNKVIAYLDPAALYGMYFNRGVDFSYYNSSNNKVTESTSSDPANANYIYSVFLNKFKNKNKVYLDVRSEKGYSYNFYENYGNTNGEDIQIGENSSPQAQVYQTNSWPIVSVESPQATNNLNNVRFNLRIDDNNDPILYFPNPNVREGDEASFYRTSREILPGGNSDWSQEIQLFFPNRPDPNSSNKPNVAFYMRVYYFRQPQTGFPNKVLEYSHYYNEAFCPIDFDGYHFRSSHPLYVAEELNDDDGSGNFRYFAKNGAFADDTRIIFYANVKTDDKKAVSSEKHYIPPYYPDEDAEKRLNLNNTKFMDSDLQEGLCTLKREYDIGSQLIIPSVNDFVVGSERRQKEDALILGLTIDELDALRNNNLSDWHDKYIFLEPDPNNPLNDNNGNRYFRFLVRLQGLQLINNGADWESAIDNTPSYQGNDIVVYTRDMRFFASQAFGDHETVTPGDHRLEMHTFHDYCIKINDNIDLSHVYDVQNMFYFYHDENGNESQICELEIVSILKKHNGDYTTEPVPPNYVNTIDYRGINGVDADISYQYNNGRVFTTGNYGNNLSVDYNPNGKAGFLVNTEFNPNLLENNNNNIDFDWTNTRRIYCEPSVLAAFIGALINVNHHVESAGIAYSDGSGYPSITHVNGTAVDVSYNIDYSTPNNDPVNEAEDEAMVESMIQFGFHYIIIGNNAAHNFLNNYISNNFEVNLDDGDGHDHHIHFGTLILNDCNDD